MLLAKIPFRTALFFIMVALIIFLPHLLPLGFLSGLKHPSMAENGFFAFAKHPLLFFASVLSAVVAVEIWCERRFKRMEF